MNTVSKPVGPSLAQRIAKVRHCMHVEVSTNVPVTNKNLFISFCQAYEQQNVATSFHVNGNHKISSSHVLSSPSLMPANIRQQWPERLLGKDFSQWQPTSFGDVTNNEDWDEGWGDTNK